MLFTCVEWATLDDLKSFRSSPACVEFLRNLPEHDNNSRVSIESGSALAHLTLDEAQSSRFLTLKHVTENPTLDVEGRVTLTTLLVPRTVDDVFGIWKDNLESVFGAFMPRGSEFVTAYRNFWFKFLAVWFWALEEDRWVEVKFGKREQTQGGESR